jgi:head-tail adaptor
MRIERPATAAVDGFVGVVKPAWVTVTGLEVVPASIDPIGSREFFGADRELSGITHRITLRETPGVQIEADWRGVDLDTGWIYDFRTPLPSHNRAELVLMASSGSAQP